MRTVSESISLTQASTAASTAVAALNGTLLETYVILGIRPGASQEQNLGALSMTILTRKVESYIPCLEMVREEISLALGEASETQNRENVIDKKSHEENEKWSRLTLDYTQTYTLHTLSCTEHNVFLID